MHEPRPAPHPPLVAAAALAVLPTLVITAVMAIVLGLSPDLGRTGRERLFDGTVLANLALWFAFAPPYLIGWVQYWDPGARARTGMLGVVALALVLWLANLGLYAFTGGLVAGLLRG